MKIDRSITLFLNYCRSKQLRPKTLQSYEQALGLFAKWLRENEQIEEVEEIKEITIREYILSLQERGKYTVCTNARSKEINYPEHRTDFLATLSNTTINNYLRNIRAYINWLVEIEAIAKSPMRRIKLLKQSRRPRDYMTDDEVKCLLRVFDKSQYPEYRDLMIAMVMLECGTRLGETLSIETEQIDLYEMTITLPAEKTKGRKDRIVFFSQRVARELRRWLHYKEDECESRYLFPVRETGFMVKVSNYERNFRNYMQRTGIDKHISPHTLRNNFAKRCLMSGMDIYSRTCPEAKFWFQYEEMGMGFCGVEVYQNGMLVYEMQGDIGRNWTLEDSGDMSEDELNNYLIEDERFPMQENGLYVHADIQGKIHIRSYKDGKIYEIIDGTYFDFRPTDKKLAYWNEETDWQELSDVAA